MFWRFGGYANISTIDSVLDKPDVTLDEILEESDLLQELKQHNTKLIEYLRDDAIFKRLLDYVISPSLTAADDELGEDEEEEAVVEKKSSFSPVRNLSLGRSRPEKSKKQEEREERERQEKARQKHAFVASEILSSEVWSITETLIENKESLTKFWSFLRQEPALDPITAGYFTKINETLLDKKTEDTLEFIKSQEGIVPAMLRHVDCPMIMDLLLKIISMEKAEGGQGIVDWLQSQNIIPMLLEYLGQQHPTFTQTSAGDFIKAIITISANASQNEQSCIGPNSLTRQLVSEECIKPMIANMLKGGNPLTVGVGIIIEVIRKNNSDYDPEVTAAQEMAPSSGDPIYLGNLLRQFAIHVPEFMELILSPKHTVSAGDATVSIKRKELPVAFGKSIEPLGFDRFKTCELMAELLHCSNMGLLNERGSEAYVRQRDLERERLRAESKNGRLQEPPSATTEFSEDGIGETGESLEIIARPSDSSHKLESSTGTDDDGFEDVGASRDLVDEMHDDFEPDSDLMDSASALKPTKSRLSLDDEFFDEPLHTPPQASPEIRKTPHESKHEPATAQSDLSTGVSKLDLKQDEAQHNSGTIPQVSIADDLVAEIDAQLSPAKEHSNPLSGNKESLLEVHGSPNLQSPGNMSPHSEDTPAPLFSPQRAHIHQEDQRSDDQTTPTQSQGIPEQSWAQDTTDEWAPHIETDIDGRPIVGDFLKMQFVEHRVVPTILDFFFRFPWNNFLHNVVYDVVQQVFNGTMERGFNRALAIDLFITGRITERVIEGQLRSDEAQARNNLRLGYMGHLTLVAEEVVKFSERHPVEILSDPVLDKVTQRIWTGYVEHTLSETRERDTAILGGVRPDGTGGARQAILESVSTSTFNNTGSAALANAGLNGAPTALDSMDLNNQTGGNFLTSGSLLSGFGSSSDEEDEDMEEIIEGNGEAGTDQHPTYTPSGLKTLSLFQDHSSSSSESNTNPILTPTSSSASDTAENNGQEMTTTSEPKSFLPPPLKISPSRARRQLAVRLALKEKERQEEKDKADAEADVGTGSGLVSNANTKSVSALDQTDDTNETKLSIGGIFSPTEGRISTPDTPAFTTGGKIHERGLHAQRRAMAAAAAAGTNKTGTTRDHDLSVVSPIRSDDGLFSDSQGDEDNEGEDDDPWASLDAAAAKVVAESSSPMSVAKLISPDDPSQAQEHEQDDQKDRSWNESAETQTEHPPTSDTPRTIAPRHSSVSREVQDQQSDVRRATSAEEFSKLHANVAQQPEATPTGVLHRNDDDISTRHASSEGEGEEVVIGLAQPLGSLPSRLSPDAQKSATAQPQSQDKLHFSSKRDANPVVPSFSSPVPDSFDDPENSPPSNTLSKPSESLGATSAAVVSSPGPSPGSNATGHNRSTMSRLFQSFGGSSSGTSDGSSNSGSKDS